jgi:lipopolysaccharide export system protein LptA
MTMHMMLANLSALMALCVALGVAQAEPQPQQSSAPPNALQGFSQNRNQPVQINAQTLDVRDKTKVATYSGNVKLVQGDTTMHCKTLIVHYDGNQGGGPGVKAAAPGSAGSQQSRRIEAIGSVIVTQKDQTATGEQAVYDISDDTVRLLAAPGGYVAVTQGPNIVRGRRSLTVYLATGLSHFEGGVESLFQPSAVKNDNHAAPPAYPATQYAAPQARATTRP